MGGFGWSNPIPFQLGGDLTEVEKAYRTLRSAVGKGGSCPDEESLEALWRQSRAKGIGLVSMMDQRAFEQAFPDHCTDLLPYYERLLLTQHDPDATAEERRATVAARFTASVGFLIEEIEAALQVIDSRFAVLLTTDDDATVTVFGRNFEDLAAAEPYALGGVRKATLYPNYSSYFVVTAVLDLGGVLPTPDESRSLVSAKRLLATALPAWIGFQLPIHSGFRLDIDHLDLTTLSP